MWQEAKSSSTALTPQQVSYLQQEKSFLEKKLAQTLSVIDLEDERLELELGELKK
jgi:hypothetical protein